MLHLVLNHTVIPETVRDDEGNVTGMQLSASSPDEEAFVYVLRQRVLLWLRALTARVAFLA